MDDYYYILKRAIKNGTVKALIQEHGADPNIKLSLSEIPITICKEAHYASNNNNDNNSSNNGNNNNNKTKNSLEQIFETGKRLGVEVPFAGLIDEKNLKVVRFFKGTNGTRHMCYWEKGNLLKKATERANTLGLKVSLGHAHPVFYKTNGKINRAYGAICSRVYYTKEDLNGQTNEMLCEIAKTKLYEQFGGDYCEIYLHAKRQHMSHYSWIASPRLNQLGVFKVLANGKVEYHPWTIEQ